ncbi:unnamed protein product [Spirodela intermedia]|uniref:Uncharacterized protein n=2 Tax=Spirodela intermedia TaxID=51605 RepID=A0A7I8IIU5_SPIIN|nr:unnamed protein product [Spirodela intermedia]CAA6657410.1 unnamed protein product [Spirodela intermedia]CAA7393469.1 unnamed protein product [Spirodela intermedia]
MCRAIEPLLLQKCGGREPFLLRPP